MTQNPYLTQDVYGACRQGRVWYLDTLARKQQFGGTPVDRLEASKKLHSSNLDQYRDAAFAAARAGEVRGASIQLAYMVKEWALYKAHYDLIEANGHYIDPTDPDEMNDFDRAVEPLVASWATELLNAQFEADRQRKADLTLLYGQRHVQLNEEYQRLIQRQGNALDQIHNHNRLYADAALHGVQQAQQGVQWMQQGVERMHQQAAQHLQWMQQGVQGMYSHGVNVMQASVEQQRRHTEYIQQLLPREMEHAVARAERRKLVTRGIIAIVLVAAIPLGIGLAWFLLRLVLHF